MESLERRGVAAPAESAAPEEHASPAAGTDSAVGATPAANAAAARSTANYQFFNHAVCEFYPCHDMPAEDLNCLFCFCPLYCLGRSCGGNFTYIGDIKDCSACTVPHRRENYDYLMQQFSRVCELASGEGRARGPMKGRA